jgi:hypothetical protein
MYPVLEVTTVAIGLQLSVRASELNSVMFRGFGGDSISSSYASANILFSLTEVRALRLTGG